MNDTLFSLPVTTQLSPSLSQRQSDELAVLVIDHPKVRGAISLQGAHLFSWQPTGEQPVLWVSDKTLFKTGKAIRGGVPICWPWFGDAEQAGLPAHGFARSQPWSLTAHDEDDERVVLTFTLTDNEQTRQLWPHAFTLIARFRLGSECQIELESHGDYPHTAALHSYFTIGDIQKISVKGLGNSYIDKVLAGASGQQQGDLQFTDRTDRVYTQPESVSQIVDPVLQRTLEAHHHHASDVIAWNPGVALSTSMADMADDGYKTMVCVETGRVSKPLVASHDNPSRLSVTLRVRKQR